MSARSCIRPAARLFLIRARLESTRVGSPPKAVVIREGQELEVPTAAGAPARSAAGARARVEPKADAPAGLFGRDARGTVEVDLTLPGLLDQRREELAARLAARVEAGA